tara:strand:- start:481 stop:1221 length:741 start_codon:yes stop_codon:yes gene_type:complete
MLLLSDGYKLRKPINLINCCLRFSLFDEQSSIVATFSGSNFAKLVNISMHGDNAISNSLIQHSLNFSARNSIRKLVLSSENAEQINHIRQKIKGENKILFPESDHFDDYKGDFNLLFQKVKDNKELYQQILRIFVNEAEKCFSNVMNDFYAQPAFHFSEYGVSIFSHIVVKGDMFKIMREQTKKHIEYFYPYMCNGFKKEEEHRLKLNNLLYHCKRKDLTPEEITEAFLNIKHNHTGIFKNDCLPL